MSQGSPDPSSTSAAAADPRETRPVDRNASAAVTRDAIGEAWLEAAVTTGAIGDVLRNG